MICRTIGAIPTLRTVARQVAPLSADSTVAEVIECFQHDGQLLELPFEDDCRMVGTITRRDLFFRHLSKPFARELYGRKPVSQLLDCKPLLLPAEWNIHQGLEELLRQDPGLERDSFGLLEDGRCRAVVAVADLMLAIARLQAGLLVTLEQLNGRIRDEVEMARRIQSKLLPSAPLRVGCLTVVGGVVNSSEISGDIFDLFPLEQGRVGLLVADVTGHGVQSGLVTTAAKAALHLLLERGSNSPSDLLDGINRAVSVTTGGALLMTAVVVIIDQVAHTVTSASAGHPFPYHYCTCDGRWELLPLEPGLPLGFDSAISYRDLTVPFLPGDRLLLYSDGLVEAERPDGCRFGEQELEQRLIQVGSLEPERLRDELFQAALAFTGQERFEDDNTIVCAVFDEENL